MIGSGALLFPDGGRDFPAALRTAVLYSDKVHTLTPFMPEVAKLILELLEPVAITDPAPARRVVEYFRFLREYTPELFDLHREGLVVPVGQQELNQSWLLAGNQVTARVWSPKDMTDEVRRHLLIIDSAYDEITPCLADAHFASAAFRAAQGDENLVGLLEEIGRDACSRLFFLNYLLQVAAVAEQAGVAALSYSPKFQAAFWSARELFVQAAKSCAPPAIIRREYAAATLGWAVLERRLPLVHDLPLHELLEIRHRRKDELESLRIALRALATQVDVSRSLPDIEQAALDIVAETVEPAVDEVYRSLRSARLDTLRKLGRSSASLASATISASVMLATGAPLDLTALVAAVGGVAGAVAETAMEQERLLRASQWAFLVHFHRANR